MGLSSWKNIYLSMIESEGLQLLYFLIILKKFHSPFLAPPDDFTNLETFMHPFLNAGDCGNVLKQSLLEYYY